MKKCVYTGKDHFNSLSAKELLESFDIYVSMPSEHHSGISPHLSLAIDGYTLFVSEENYDKAIEILKAYSYIENDEVVIEVDDNIKIKCPNCGSKNIKLAERPKRLLILILYLLGNVPVKIAEYYGVCNECAYKWTI